MTVATADLGRTARVFATAGSATASATTSRWVRSSGICQWPPGPRTTTSSPGWTVLDHWVPGPSWAAAPVSGPNCNTSIPHLPSSNHRRRVYVRSSGLETESSSWRGSERSGGRTTFTWSSTEVMGGIPHGSKSIEMTCGISWRTSWTRTRRCSFDMDESIPKFRNESLSKIDVVLHHLCTNPHNDSAQNCQFPWGSVTHMSGAPPERQKLSAACSHGTTVYAASSLDRLLRPWDGASPLSHHPQNSRCTTRRTARTNPTGTTAAMADTGGVKKHHPTTDGVTQTAPPSLE